ncbi:Small subunit processome component 20-like protein [Trichoplax sp. H2]|nr:Small subunit processome component 20-like protein [Trichoplax sp. H2]|eukprot:RDD45796.1 Small subunit processome component 20-like protein [Trichoplax sp. H2]
MAKKRMKSLKDSMETRFKFKGFHERIASIRIDVIHRAQKRKSNPEDAETFFMEALFKWTDLNCSTEFVQFRREVYHYCQTLPQLVHHKNEIFQLLKTYLEKKSILTISTLLDLAVNFARDLQSDFYPYFGEFYAVLIVLLNVGDPDVIEDVFKTLAYLFKYLWRHMIPDLRNLFKVYQEMLKDSQKIYIKSFATESFSFLMRKAPDQHTLANYVLSYLDNATELCEGIGLLYFETIKGVSGQFHTCINEVLPVLLQKLGPIQEISNIESLAYDSVMKTLVYTVQACAAHSQNAYMQPVWNALSSEVKRLHEKLHKFTKEEEHHQLARLLHLVKELIQCGRSRCIVDFRSFFEDLKKLLFDPSLQLEHVNAIIEIFACSLVSLDRIIDKVLQEDIADAVFSCNCAVSVVSNFCHQCQDAPLYAEVIFQKLSQYCGNKTLRNSNIQIRDELLEVLANVLTNAERSRTYRINFDSCVPPEILKGMSLEAVPEEIVNALFLSNLNPPIKQERVAAAWSSLLCLRHTKLSRLNDSVECVTSVMLWTINKILATEENSWTNNLLHTFSQAVLYLVGSLAIKDTIAVLPLQTLIKMPKYCFHHEGFLYAVNFYMEKVGQEDHIDIFTSDNVKTIFSLLASNFSSPSRPLRLLSLKILRNIVKPIVSSEDADRNGWSDTAKNIINNLVMAEEASPTFHGYRDRLMHLRKLVYSREVYEGLPRILHEGVLQYIIGQFYVNLNLIWNEIIAILKTFAGDMIIFWPVFREHLDRSEIVDKSSSESYSIADEAINNDIENFTSNSLMRCFNSYVLAGYVPREEGVNSRPDNQNFRYLLWKSMLEFSDSAESKSRDFISHFIRFARNEFLVDGQEIVSFNELNRQLNDNNDNIDDNDNDIAGNDVVTHGFKSSVRMRRNHYIVKLLSVQLSLFAKFRNPKALYKEAQLRDIYNNLLLHNDPKVQMLVINVLLTYKYSYLIQYKENFENLLNDESFRDELTKFSIDPSSSVIDNAHRKDLIPILIRILYGQLFRRSLGADNKSNIASRRAFILRFLAGCTNDEFQIFTNLLFEPFEGLDKIKPLYNEMQKIPIKKRIGFLSMFSLIISKLGTKVTDILPSFLDVLLAITDDCIVTLSERQQIDGKILPSMKKIRQLAYNSIRLVFQVFEDFDFSNHIKDIFRVAVWPQLSRLPTECIQHPTPLLKLFYIWSQNTIYVPFLYQWHPNNENQFILSEIFSCLSSPKVSSAVVTMVLEIANNLLLANEVNPDSDRREVLSSYIGMLLRHLSDSLSSYLAVTSSHPSKLNKMSSVTKLEFSVLSKISPLVSSSDESCDLIRLLLKFISKGKRLDKYTEANILQSICNLIGYVTDRMKFFNEIAILFTRISGRESRDLLCNTLKAICCDEVGLLENIYLIFQLNCWEIEQLDQPDYEKRLKAFSTVNKLIKDGIQNPHFYLPVVCNCLYFTLQADDTAMLHSSGYCLDLIVGCLTVGKDDEVIDTCIMQSMLSTIKQGIKVQNEVSRNEFIRLLGVIVRKFSSSKKLSCIHGLLNQNPDLDFFENVRHLQVHRRIRAFKQLAAYCRQSQLSADWAVSFFLPMATNHIFDKKGSKDPNLITEVINVVGAIAYLMPWHRYVFHLRHFLRQLTRRINIQKILIRVIVAVLDNFHIDISNADCLPGLDIAKTGELFIETEENIVEDAQDKLDEELTESASDTVDLHLKQKVFLDITSKILPELRDCLKSKSIGAHKHSSMKDDYQNEMLRIPLALAMVKLLLKLPKSTLEVHLPGIILRVCQALKSHNQEVRDICRDILTKIADALGPNYLSYVVKELRTTLARGYQLHILGYTLHSVLLGITEQLKPGNLDVCIEMIMEIAIEDTFGDRANEKEIDSISKKLRESKNKSYGTFEILATYASNNSIGNVLLPLKKILQEAQNTKIVNRVESVLHRICTGLLKNSDFNFESLLILAYQAINESSALLQSDGQKLDEDLGQISNAENRSISFLLLPEPRRGGNQPKANLKTNSYVFVEFGLKIFLMIIKNRTIKKEDKELLRIYARAGAGKGNNAELVHSSFKAVSILIGNYGDVVLSPNHVKLLLTYVEEDIHDHSRQATALSVIKAIVSRGIEAEEVHDIMIKIQEMSINGSPDFVRLQCRQLYMRYVLDYPLGKKIEKIIQFYLNNLNHEYETGRISALEMIASMLNEFPSSLLFEYSLIIFMSLATCLVNDDSATCRKMNALAVRTLLEKMDVTHLNELLELVISWLKGHRVIHQRLALQLLGIFAECQSDFLEKRLKDVLPLVLALAKDGDYEQSDNLDHENIRIQDSRCYYLINTLQKISDKYDLTNDKYQGYITSLWDCIIFSLEYPHMWVRLTGCQLIGFIFSRCKPDKAIHCKTFLISHLLEEDTTAKLQSLIKIFISQLKSKYLDSALADQVTKNLIYICKVIQSMSDSKQEDLSFKNILESMCKIARLESGNTPKSVQKRSCVIKWIAAMVLDLDYDVLISNLSILLQPLQKESSSTTSSEELKILCDEIVGMIKKRCDPDKFAMAYSSSHQTINEKKLNRKRQKAFEAVANPQISAQKRLKRNLRKKESRKRKMYLYKPEKLISKRKKLDQS